MISFSEVLEIFVAGVVFLSPPLIISCYIIIFINGKEIQRYTKLFFLLSFWVVAVVLFWANWHTNFSTVLNGVVIILICSFSLSSMARKDNFDVKFVSSFRGGLRSSAAVIGYFGAFVIIRAVFYSHDHMGFLTFGVSDYILYSKFSNLIMTTGVENIQFQYPGLETLKNREPYHYFDLWLYSIFGNFLKFNSSIIIGASGSILLVTALYGLAALSDSIRSSGRMVPILLLLLLLFYSGTYLNDWDNHNFLHFVKMYSVSLFGNPRHCVVLIFILSAILLRERVILASGFLLSIPFVSIVPAPGILVFLSVHLFFLLKKNNLQPILSILALMVLMASLILFYHFEWLIDTRQAGLVNTENNIQDKLQLRDFLYSFRILIFRSVIAHWFFLLAALFGLLFYRKRIKISGSFISLLVAFGVGIFFSILSSDINGFQFYTNLLIPVAPIVLVIVFQKFQSREIFYRRLFITGVVVVIAVNQMGEYFRTQTQDIGLNDKENLKFVQCFRTYIEQDNSMVYGGALVSEKFYKYLSANQFLENSYPYDISLITSIYGNLSHAFSINAAKSFLTGANTDSLLMQNANNPFLQCITENGLINMIDFDNRCQVCIEMLSPAFILVENQKLLSDFRLDDYTCKCKHEDSGLLMFVKNEK